MEKKCKDRIRSYYQGRMKDLRKLVKAERNGEEHKELGSFNEYGLCFDYCPKGTFTGQKRGYFRYQLSTGGPGDEFRFYCDADKSVVHIEYWFLDWFDGASISLNGKDKELLIEIFKIFESMGAVDARVMEANERVF